MTGKEIIRALLRGDRPERLAWGPCIDPYTQSGLSPELRALDVFALQQHFGSDMFRGTCAYVERFEPPVRHRREDLGDGRVLDTYETPRGPLREVHTYVAESPYIPFPTEYIIKSFADLEAYVSLVEHTIVEPDQARLREVIAAYPDVMVTSAICDVPFAELFTKLIGIENFVLMHQEDPPAVRRAMDAMQVKHRRQVEASCGSPIELFICYENTNVTAFGTTWIDEYELPCLDEYADIIHSAGKHVLVHMCGHIRRIVDRIAGARFDGIIDVAPPPTGDCDLPTAAMALARRGRLVGGGIECNTFTLGDVEQFEREVRALIERVDDKSRFILGSGDAVPQGASEANLKRAEAIAKGMRLG